MNKPLSRRPDVSDRRDDADAVVALMRLLTDSGLKPRRLEATFQKTTALEDLDLLEACLTEFRASGGRMPKLPRAA